MSRKDYEALAEAIRAIRPEGKISKADNQWYSTIDALCVVLGRDNPRFDEDRFRAACYRRNE